MRDNSSFKRKIHYWTSNPQAGTIGLGAVGFAALAGSALTAGASVYNASQARRAAGQAGQSSQVDIDALDAKARQIAQQNATDSAALEQAMTPEVPALRTAANQGVLGGLGTTATDDYTRGLLSNLAEHKVGNAQTPLLQAAIAKAKADLAQGGRLNDETQNAVTRAALAKAGTVAPGGLGLGRDITARDLGLTSLQLEQQRLANASQLGGQELQLGQLDTNTAFNNNANLLNAVQLLNAGQSNQFNRNLAAAQYGQSIRPPVVGLDPSSVVNLSVGNANALGASQANQANIYGQQSQNWGNLAGQFAGQALLNYNNSQPANTGTVNKSAYFPMS